MSPKLPYFYTSILAAEVDAELEQNVTLPSYSSVDKLGFDQIGGRRFEILSYLVLLKENTEGSHLTLVKASGDQGLDVTEHTHGQLSKVVQCKNQKDHVSGPLLARELMKLALHNLNDRFIPEAGIVYEIWAPGGFSEPAESFVADWPSSWAEEVAKSAFDDVTSEYELLKTMDWKSVKEYLLDDFPNLIKLVRVEGIEISSRLRTYPTILVQFFSANIVAEISQVRDVVDDALRELQVESAQGELEISIELGLGPVEERDFPGESQTWRKAQLMYRFTVHLETPKYVEGVELGLVFYSGDRLYDTESNLPAWLNQSIELGDKGDYHRLLHSDFQIGNVGPSSFGTTDWRFLHISLDHAPWMAAVYVVAKGLDPQMFQIELPSFGTSLVPKGGNGVQVRGLQLASCSKPKIAIGHQSLLANV
jgi:acetolactate synthase small subunit